MTGQSGEFLWRISGKVPEQAVDLYEDYLRRYCGAVSSVRGVDDSVWVLEGLSEQKPNRVALERGASAIARDTGLKAPEFRYDPAFPADWVAESLSSFPPVRWGRYYIHGSHIGEPPPGGAVPLKLDAGTAFGSGEHPTTGGCLLALDSLARKHRFRRPLDVGCGSGILALAAAKTWKSPVLSSDIDPESVRVTNDNARINGVQDRIRSVVSDGYNNQLITRNAPYDLITSNILARPLARMAKSMAGVLTEGGTAVISGFVERDAPWLIATYRQLGLKLMDHRVISGWSALVLRRR